MSTLRCELTWKSYSAPSSHCTWEVKEGSVGGRRIETRDDRETKSEMHTVKCITGETVRGWSRLANNRGRRCTGTFDAQYLQDRDCASDSHALPEASDDISCEQWRAVAQWPLGYLQSIIRTIASLLFGSGFAGHTQGYNLINKVYDCLRIR